MPSIYLETSIIGYLASRPVANPIVAGNQLLTRDWWNNHRDRFELFVSGAVINECSSGDPTAIAERLPFLEGVPILDISELARTLANKLIVEVPLPVKAEIDALHIAVASATGMDYLLTWNCKHIANPSLRRRIEEVISAEGLVPPVICTPQELIYV